MNDAEKLLEATVFLAYAPSRHHRSLGQKKPKLNIKPRHQTIVFGVKFSK